MLIRGGGYTGKESIMKTIIFQIILGLDFTRMALAATWWLWKELTER